VVAGDGFTVAGQARAAETGEKPDFPRWLAWALTAAAVATPAAAAGLAGLVVAVDLARSRGVDMALPSWLGPALWVTGIAALALAVIVWRWMRKPSAAAQVLPLRMAMIGLQVAGLLCTLTSALVPS
jgi:hypothetical protein